KRKASCRACVVSSAAILVPQRLVDRPLVALGLTRLTLDALGGLPAPFLRFAFRRPFLRFHSGHGGLLPRVQQMECRHRNSIQSLMPTTRSDVSVFCWWT